MTIEETLAAINNSTIMNQFTSSTSNLQLDNKLIQFNPGSIDQTLMI